MKIYCWVLSLLREVTVPKEFTLCVLFPLFDSELGRASICGLVAPGTPLSSAIPLHPNSLGLHLRILKSGFINLHHIQSLYRDVLLNICFLITWLWQCFPGYQYLLGFALNLGHLGLLEALRRCSMTLELGHTGTVTNFLSSPSDTHCHAPKNPKTVPTEGPHWEAIIPPEVLASAGYVSEDAREFKPCGQMPHNIMKSYKPSFLTTLCDPQIPPAN